jgi:hypothetical protein
MNKDLTTKWYNPNEIISLKKWMKARSTLFEAELIRSIESFMDNEWNPFEAKTLIKFYMDTMKNAMITNKFWTQEPDTRSRMAAADKITKIMTWWMGNSKWVTVNVQNNNLWWWTLPKVWEKLIY